MTEWIITPERYSGECEHFIDGDCGARENTKCNFENCPLKIDDRPITAEWLESVGATKDTRFSWVEYRFDTCDGFFELVASFFDGSQNVKLMHYERGNILPHIQTRHQFSELYRLLSGRELKQ